MALDIQLRNGNAESAASREQFVIPSEPGLAIMGKEPVLGAVRRNSGLPVLRDMLSKDDEESSGAFDR